jgi:hypothetical protein
VYCDDSRVTHVDAKEVVVSLPCPVLPLVKLTPLPPGQTRLHLILQESQNLNYTLIFLPIFPAFFLASLPLNTLSLSPCCVLFNPCNYTDYA